MQLIINFAAILLAAFLLTASGCTRSVAKDGAEATFAVR